jgi:hypothetical protein
MRRIETYLNHDNHFKVLGNTYLPGNLLGDKELHYCEHDFGEAHLKLAKYYRDSDQTDWVLTNIKIYTIQEYIQHLINIEGIQPIFVTRPTTLSEEGKRVNFISIWFTISYIERVYCKEEVITLVLNDIQDNFMHTRFIV